MPDLVHIGYEETVSDLDVEVVDPDYFGPEPDTYKLVTLNGVVTPVALDFKEEPTRPGVYMSGEPVVFGHRPGQGGIFMEGSDGQFREI